MRRFLLPIVMAVLVMWALPAEAGRKVKVESKQVVDLTRFLEEQPLDADAPLIRSLLIDWEEKSKDVEDIVCLDLLFAVANPDVPNGSQVMVQFIFGSAAYQLANPGEKGKLLPSQLAGLRSMLKAYAAFLAADGGARIPALDEWAAKEAAGTLESELAAAVSIQCSDKPADGKPART
jgi:hypothetical protein